MKIQIQYLNRLSIQRNITYLLQQTQKAENIIKSMKQLGNKKLNMQLNSVLKNLKQLMVISYLLFSMTMKFQKVELKMAQQKKMP
jgi:hypothetical protein